MSPRRPSCKLPESITGNIVEIISTQVMWEKLEGEDKKIFQTAASYKPAKGNPSRSKF
jgi:hypothetical protein